MNASDPDVNRALAEVDRLMGEGAAVAKLRFPAWFLVLTCLAAAAFGAICDIPRDMWGNSGWFVRQPLILVLLVSWVAIVRVVWRRARPLPKAFGRMWVVVIFVGHMVLYAGATAVGLCLQAVGVPLPFTWAGLGYGVALVGLLLCLTPRINGWYQANIKRGRW